MAVEKRTGFAERVLAWAYSTSFPVGIGALICLRVYFGYDWPFPNTVGLALLSIGLALLLADALPRFAIHRHSPVLRYQSIYSSLFTSVAGIWIYTKIGGDLGLLIVITVALGLWPRSHREVLRLEGR